MSDEEKWVGTTEAAKIAGCHVQTLYRYARAGIIRRIKRPTQRRFESLFLVSEMEWLKKEKGAIFEAKSHQSRKAKKPDDRRIKRVKAKCPMCGKMHKSRREWTGTGTPRFFCSKCSMLTHERNFMSDWQNRAMI